MITSTHPEKKIVDINPVSDINIIRVLVSIPNETTMTEKICGQSFIAPKEKHYMIEVAEASTNFVYWRIAHFELESSLIFVEGYQKAILKLVRFKLKNDEKEIPVDCMLICFDKWEAVVDCEKFFKQYANIPCVSLSILPSVIGLQLAVKRENVVTEETVSYPLSERVILYTNTSVPKRLA